MIALTQEKREELKAFLSASIESRCTVYTLAKQRELEALRDQISLAALTAEKRATVDVVGVIWNEWKPDVGAFLFTAPPVPEIKLPSAELIKEVFLANGFKEKVQADGRSDLNTYVYDAALALIERLNGLGE